MFHNYLGLLTCSQTFKLSPEERGLFCILSVYIFSLLEVVFISVGGVDKNERFKLRSLFMVFMFRYAYHVKHLIKQLNENPSQHALHRLEKYLHSSDVAFQQLIHHMSDESNFSFFQGSRQEFDQAINDLNQEHRIISALNQRFKLVNTLEQFRQWEQLFLQNEPKLHILSKDDVKSLDAVVRGAKLKLEGLEHHLHEIENMDKEMEADERRLESAFSGRLLSSEIHHPPQQKLTSNRLHHL